MDVSKLLGSFLGQDAANTVAGTAGGMVNQAKSAASSMPGGLMGGAAAGGLVALMMGNKKARKISKKVLTYGGMAAVGGLAYKAYSDYKSGQPAPQAPTSHAPAPRQLPEDVVQISSAAQARAYAPPPPADSPFQIENKQDASGEDLRLGLIRAMISAAKADGHMDADEQALIYEQIGSQDLAPDEKAFLFDQLSAPSDPLEIAALAKGEEQAAELYLASALAIDVDTPEEARYMERLGDALRLPMALRGQLDAHAAQAKAAG